MKDLTIQDIETIVHRDENRVMEAKETTGELVKGMQSGCAFLNTDGGWLFFGIHPTKLTILGQDVADRTIMDKIAGALFKGGKAEGWGRGILNIFNYCHEAGMPEPNYEFVTNFVCLTIGFKMPLVPYMSEDVNGDVNGDINGDINGDVNGDVNSLTGSLKDVYLIVLKNPGIKIKQVAEFRGKSESTVWKQLTSLRRNGFIEYRGSNKSGG